MDTQVINTSSKNESAKETLKKGAALTGAAGLGAGAVVIRDIPEKKVAVGNPTRLIAN